VIALAKVGQGEVHGQCAAPSAPGCSNPLQPAASSGKAPAMIVFDKHRNIEELSNSVV